MFACWREPRTYATYRRCARRGPIVSTRVKGRWRWRSSRTFSTAWELRRSKSIGNARGRTPNCQEGPMMPTYGKRPETCHGRQHVFEHPPRTVQRSLMTRRDPRARVHDAASSLVATASLAAARWRSGIRAVIGHRYANVSQPRDYVRDPLEHAALRLRGGEALKGGDADGTH